MSTPLTVIENARLEVFDGANWQDYIGFAASITINRGDDQPGTLVAELLGDDTATALAAATMQRPIRVMVREGSGFSPIFTGRVEDLAIARRPLVKNPARRVRVTITATDLTGYLANRREPRGVASLNAVRWLLDGAGAPFTYNGTTSTSSPTGTLVATNENASLWDQILIARDVVNGAAWVDPTNTLCLFDRAALPRTSIATMLGPETYREVSTDWTSDQIINTVSIIWRRFDIGTDTSRDVTYGPYVDAASVATWGTRSATFTLQGTTEVEADIEAYAAAVLADNANSEPSPRFAVIPVNSLDALVWTRADLNALMDVTTPDGSVFGVRVSGVRHEITPRAWLTTLTFADPSMRVPPSTTPGTGVAYVPPGSISGLDIQPGTIPVDRVAFTARDLDGTATFAQDAEPIGAVGGDLWIDTNDQNRLYRYDGTTWQPIRDQAIAAAADAAADANTAASAAATAAATAAGIANGKGKVIVQPTEPATGDRLAQNLWIDTTGGANTPKRWTGSAWASVTDKVATDAADAAVDALAAADAAAEAASAANAAAGAAQATANGKNKVTYSTSAPGTTANAAGDIWFVIAGSLIVAQYQGQGGTTWAQRSLDSAVIANLDAGKISTGFLDANRLAANSITTGKIAAGAVTAGTIAAGAITADKIAATALDAKTITGLTISNPGAILTPDYLRIVQTGVGATGYIDLDGNGGPNVDAAGATAAIILKSPWTGVGSVANLAYPSRASSQIYQRVDGSLTIGEFDQPGANGGVRIGRTGTPVKSFACGDYAGNTNASAQVVIAHGMGVAPKSVATTTKESPGGSTRHVITVATITSTTITFTVRRDTGGLVSQPTGFYWQAWA